MVIPAGMVADRANRPLAAIAYAGTNKELRKSTTRSSVSPDHRGNNSETCRSRAKLPSTPSMIRARPSHTNISDHCSLMAAIRASRQRAVPDAVKTWTPKANCGQPGFAWGALSVVARRLIGNLHGPNPVVEGGSERRQPDSAV